MKVETTPWLLSSHLHTKIGVPTGSMHALERDKKLWRGWLIQRRPATNLERTYITQDWLWRGVRLGEYQEATGITVIEVPIAWFGELSRLRQGKCDLKVVRELEDDLDTLRTDKGMIRSLEHERATALTQIQRAVQAIWSHPRAKDMPLGSTDELLNLFRDVTLIPMLEDAREADTEEILVPEKKGVCAGMANALIVGGDPRAHVERNVRGQLGFDSVEWWATSEKTNLSVHSGKVSQVANGQYDIVFCLLRFCRHRMFYAFRDACKASGTPYAVLQRGYGISQFEQAARDALGKDVYVHG